MYIVIDTQAIHQDFHLTNIDTQRLINEARTRGWIVCIPEVVLREMLSDFRKQTGNAIQNIDNSLRDLSRFRRTDPPEKSVATLDEEVKAYEARLRTLLESQKVQALPIPSTAALDLFERYQARRKPFKSDGKGLNDVLIWESVLALCRGSTRPVALITGNTKDFADPLDELVLHTDLQDDLDSIGFGRFNAELHKSVAAFAAKFLSPTSTDTDSADAAVKESAGVSE